MLQLQTAKKSIYNLGCILYALSFGLFFCSPVLTYLCYLRLSRILFLSALLLSIVSIGCLIVGKEYITFKHSYQMMIIYLNILLIFVPFFIRAYRNDYSIHNHYAWIELTAIVIGMSFWIICSLKGLKEGFIKRWFNIIKNNAPYCGVIVMVILLNLEQLNNWVKWDSANYYKFIVRLNEITFSPNDIHLFKACGHSSFSYMLYSSIGENIFPFRGLGVRIANIIVFCICLLLLKEIISYLFPNIQKIHILFVVCIFAFTPIMMCSISDITPELYIVLFVLLVLNSFYKQRYILMSFFSIMLVFTKETSVFLLIAFYLGFAFAKLVNFIRYKEKLINEESISFSLITYFSVVVFLLYFVNDTSWGFREAQALGERGNVFGLNYYVIFSKLKQIFVLNFSWLITLVLIVGLIILLFTKKIKINTKRLFPLLSMAGCFYALQLGYVTYTFPRYILLTYVFGSLLLAYVLSYFKKPFYYHFIFIGAFVVQNFAPIDIVSNILFETESVGTRNMIIDSPLYIDSSGTLVQGEDAKILRYSEYSKYNRQWSYFDTLMDKAFAKIEYNKDDIVVLPDSFSPYSNGTFWGYWDDIYYDTDSKKINMVFDRNRLRRNEVKVSYMYYDSNSEDWDKYQNVYYFGFEFSEETNRIIRDEAQFVDEIRYRGWILKIYKLK